MRTFKENALFRGLTAHGRYNACVGNNGDPYDLYDYAQGYFEATGILVRGTMKPGVPIASSSIRSACPFVMPSNYTSSTSFLA